MMNSLIVKKSMLLTLAAALLASACLWLGSGRQSASAATTSFRFVVMGDSRGSTDGINETTLRSLLQKVQGLSTQPSFLLFTGDQVQGGSNLATELSDWKNIVDDYYPLNVNYPALGNHEHDETAFSTAFSYLPSGQLSGYQRSVYYFDYGNARFITLNSDRTDSSGHYVIDATQRAWLESLLNNNGKTHNFVMMHVPAYPIGAHYGQSLDANPAERDAFWDIIDQYKVTAVLVGHEHNYNRRKIDSSFNGSGRTFGNSIYQLTLGGAGAPLSTAVSDYKGVVVGPKASYHYMVVDIADNTATFTVYDSNNTQLDSFTVTQGGTSTPTPTPTATPAQTTKSFQNGAAPTSAYAGSIDTHLSQNAPTTNYGNAASVLVDGDDPSGSAKDLAALLKWDLSSIPAGSTVTSASITLNITDSSSSSYQLYELKRSWSESAATWNQYASGSNWQTAGAAGSLDSGTVVLGTLAPTATGAYTLTLNSSGIALIQNWMNTPSANNGFVIKNSSSTDGVDFSSSEATTIAQRPKLTVTYH